MVMFPPWKLYYQIKQKEKTFYKNKGAYESVKFFPKLWIWSDSQKEKELNSAL